MGSGCCPRLYDTQTTLPLPLALDLAVSSQLSLWDCVYIALAAEHGCRLVTADRCLFRGGAAYPSRVSGLVYLDAIADPVDFPGHDQEYTALVKNLPKNQDALPPPTAEERKSWTAYLERQKKQEGYAFPESEVRSMFETNSDGSRGRSRTPSRVFQAIGEGAERRDYSKICAPILAFHAIPYPLDHPKRQLPVDADARAATVAFHNKHMEFMDRYKRKLIEGDPGARLMELPGANHYVHFSNQEQVLKEIRAFIEGIAR